MSVKSKELREKRAPLAKQIRDLADKANTEKRDFTAEEKQTWDKINGEYNTFTRDIERAEAVERLDDDPPGDPKAGRDDYDGKKEKRKHNPRREEREKVTEEDRATAFQAWCRRQLGEPLSKRHVAACRKLGFSPNQRKLILPLLRTDGFRDFQREFRSSHPSRATEALRKESRAMSSLIGASGGYLVAPETMIRNLEINMLAFGGMRQVAELIGTTTGERMSWPTADDTTNTGEQLGESTSIGSSVDPTFGKIFWDAYKFSSKPILVPFELLEDSAFQLATVLGDMLGERLGRITNTKFTVGTGASTPKGIVIAAGSFSAASATALAADDVLGLIHSIDPAYRNGAGFMMHDAIMLVLRKLKDGNGQYLWQSGMTGGAPDSIFGYPITINQDMDSTISSGKKTGLFGQLSKYKIRRVNQIRMYRLEERYRDTDQDGFVAFLREDGNLLDAGTDPVKVLTH